MSPIDLPEIQAVLRRAQDESLIDPEDTTLHVLSKAALKARMQTVRSCFPDSAIHTAAVKTNPLSEVLKVLVNEGFGLECASFEETQHALNAEADNVAWDSPAKTDLELEELSENQRVIVSCDSLQEAQRYASFAGKQAALLRINPQMQGSAHQSMTVGGARSKFGEPITNRQDIIDFALQHKWVAGLHVHSSSQTINHTDLIHAVRSIVDLANEINAQRRRPLTVINIGGGFPVDYAGTDAFDLRDYATQLLDACPELANGTYRMITEFGRYYHANCGFTATQVSHTKAFDNHQIIIAHAGADMFLRECYQPGVWPHRFTLLDARFNIRATETVSTDIAGPLCFGGDFVQKNFPFLRATSGDWLVVHDTGSNSISLWSKHCSRAFPKCLLYEGDETEVIRRRDTLERNLSIWER